MMEISWSNKKYQETCCNLEIIKTKSYENGEEKEEEENVIANSLRLQIYLMNVSTLERLSCLMIADSLIE